MEDRAEPRPVEGLAVSVHELEGRTPVVVSDQVYIHKDITAAGVGSAPAAPVIPPPLGLPRPIKPASELFGEILLERGRPRVVRQCYDLFATPAVRLASDAEYIARAGELGYDGAIAPMVSGMVVGGVGNRVGELIHEVLAAEGVDVTWEQLQSARRLVARQLGMPADECDLLLLASPLHDIGKIGVSDQILLKPGPLTEDEWREMRRHPTTASTLLTGLVTDTRGFRTSNVHGDTLGDAQRLIDASTKIIDSL